MKSLQQILTRAGTERDHLWALATLVRTEGSTYRKPGARMLIDRDGATIGVLSGGCLEEEIARHGLEVMANGIPQLIDFDTRRLYGCAGKLGIFVERIPAAGESGNFLTAMTGLLAQRAICRVKIDYLAENGRSEILPEHALVVERPHIFVQTVSLPVRLLLFGSGPEVMPIQAFASALGWIVRHHAHPDELPAAFQVDTQTAAVVMTHNFGRDLAALDRLLPLGLPYVGLLGPKRRQAELLARFQDYRELEPGWLDALHSPAGLDIGSESPEEIALAIVSEASAILSGRSGGLLMERSLAVHEPQSPGKEA